MQLIEEMAELTQAINKYRRFGSNINLNNLIEELADVSVMVEQVKFLIEKEVAYAENLFGRIVTDKIERMQIRIINQRELEVIAPKDKMIDLLIKDKEGAK